MSSRTRLPAAITMVVALIALATTVDRHPAGAQPALPLRWSLVLPAGPWGVAADKAGAVVTVDNGSVLSVSPRGRVRWTTRGVDVVEGNPSVGSDTVVVGGERGVTALARDDGRRRWQATTSAPVTSVALTPSVAGGRPRALVGDQAGTLAAFDALDGAVRWSVHHDGRLWSSARVDGPTGTVVASWHGTAEPVVQAFDLSTGALRWSAPTASGAAAPVVTDGLAVLAAGDGHRHAWVEARDVVSGEVRWHVSVPASFEEAIEPAAGEGDIVVVDHFGTLTSLGIGDGRRRWQQPLGEPVLETRVGVTASRVALTTYGGNVIVLRRADGHVVTSLAAHTLGGSPTTGSVVRWGGRPGYLAGLRLTEPGTLVLVRLP